MFSTRYSRRLSWALLPNAFSRLIEQKRSEGASLLDLTSSNPTDALPDYPHTAIHRVYSQIADFTYRPNPIGEERTRLAICEYYRTRGIAVSPRQIALTASTSEAYAILFKLLCDPEDEIIVPVPSYPLFEYLASLESVRPIPYRLLYDGSWFIDFANLIEALSPRTRAIVVVNPNNPTGSFLKKWELERLIATAQEHNLPVISDEVFIDYELTPIADRVTTLIGNESILSFSLNGLSKAACMPQMKLGWVTVNGPPPVSATARERLELVLDTYLSVSIPVQAAASGLFQIGSETCREVLGAAQTNLRSLESILRDTSAHVLHTEGGWSAIIQVPRTWSEDIWTTKLLEEQNVIVQPGYFFDMATEAYLVVSLITPPDQFAEGIRRLGALIQY